MDGNNESSLSRSAKNGTLDPMWEILSKEDRIMKLSSIGANMTELQATQATILFSYKTPVAAHISGSGYYRTEKKWSTTTTRHINKWLASQPAEVRPQEWFDALL